VVDLITDSSMGVSARIGTSNATGIVQPKVGEPNDLLLQYLPDNAPAVAGEDVVTSGTVAPPDNSLYPPGILIGQVTSIDEESGYKSANVHPVVNLHDLDVVQVLTVGPGSRAAAIGSVAASLPAQSPPSSGEQLADAQVGE
jgi:cell shape-determining protein MreC